MEPRSSQAASQTASHWVRFYDHEADNLSHVAAHIHAALERGRTGIVIAKPALRRDLVTRLQTMPHSQTFGSLITLDAQETLNKFMMDGWPHEGKFTAVVGELVQRAGLQQPPAAYGEMVALLCEQGNFQAAIRLEKLWNDLLGQHAFSLLCAYPRRLFTDGLGTHAAYRPLCDAHHQVLEDSQAD